MKGSEDMPAIPAPGKLREEDREFKASLGHLARRFSKAKQNNKKQSFKAMFETI
jgi:hypothetical protein